MINNTLLFVEGDKGFVVSAIQNNLIAEGYKLITCADNDQAIMDNHDPAETILYYLPSIREQVKKRIDFLTSICIKDHKTLCLIGDELGVKEAMKSGNSERINAVYKRPVDVHGLVLGVKKLSKLSQEFSQPKSILIIDDDTDFLNIANNWLKNDFVVAGVRSGKEALRYLDSYRPDMILLDYEMPEMDGYQVLKRLRKKSMFDNVPVIYLTGKSDKDSVMRIMELKPDGYLLKSMPKDELIDSLRRVFAGKILSKKANPQAFRN